ncbi:outer membrane protein transport protein [bacterium SCSIO 12741]|nr:outer membrane protein transport protein [bacterium SCSIO 12741]
MQKLLFTALAVVLFLSSSAGGFQVSLQGQKQIGMGHVGVPMLFGASSIYFNPGALPMLDSTFSASLGMSTIFSKAYYQNETYNQTFESDNPVGTPFSAYANYILKERISIGLGVYTPFGSSVVWDDQWAGRYLIQKIQLRSFFIQPTVGYKVMDNLGIGVGFIWATGNVKINRAINLPVGDNTETVELSSGANGYGFNAGIYYDPMEQLHIGLSYKSGIKMEAKDGDVTMKVPASLNSNFPETNKFSTTLNLPGSVNFGIGYDLTDKITIAAEANWVNWDVYDSLVFDFETNTDGLEDSRNPRLYENTIAFRLGANYQHSEKLSVRLGAYYDPSPVQDEYFTPETPNMDNLGFTGGASYSPMKNLSIDVSLLYIYGLERESQYKPANFSGTYRTTAWVPGLGLSYNF